MASLARQQGSWVAQYDRYTDEKSWKLYVRGSDLLYLVTKLGRYGRAPLTQHTLQPKETLGVCPCPCTKWPSSVQCSIYHRMKAIVAVAIAWVIFLSPSIPTPSSTRSNYPDSFSAISRWSRHFEGARPVEGSAALSGDAIRCGAADLHDYLCPL